MEEAPHTVLMERARQSLSGHRAGVYSVRCSGLQTRRLPLMEMLRRRVLPGELQREAYRAARASDGEERASRGREASRSERQVTEPAKMKLRRELETVPVRRPPDQAA